MRQRSTPVSGRHSQRMCQVQSCFRLPAPTALGVSSKPYHGNQAGDFVRRRQLLQLLAVLIDIHWRRRRPYEAMGDQHVVVAAAVGEHGWYEGMSVMSHGQTLDALHPWHVARVAPGQELQEDLVQGCIVRHMPDMTDIAAPATSAMRSLTAVHTGSGHPLHPVSHAASRIVTC